MRFAIVGSRGLLGSQLGRSLDHLGIEWSGFDRNLLNLDKCEIEQLANLFEGHDVIVNAAAFTAVDKAESESELAFQINAHAVGQLAKASSNIGARFVQISTDYVFDGSGNKPYSIHDSPNPKTIYGKSKLLGEELASKSINDLVIVRTAWLYGETGSCFPKKILQALSEQEEVRVVSDQYGQPTWAKDVAEQVINYAILSSPPRIVHAVSSGVTNWAEFAAEISSVLAPEAASKISPVSSEAFETKARRPTWSVLDNSEGPLASIGHWRDRWLLASSEVLF